MSGKVLVLGGGFAGLNCALSLDREGFDVTLVDDNGEHVFKPGLTELIRGRFNSESLKLDLKNFLSSTNIDFKQARVEDILPEEKTVKVEDGSLEYDYLVLALGSEKREAEFSLQYAEDFYSLNSAEDAVESFDDSEEVIVIGSGYTGVEVASELNERGIDVQVIDSTTRPMSSSPEKASHTVLEYFNNNGIKFMGGKNVKVVTNYGVELENGTEVNADNVIWCGGIEASKVAQDSLGGSGKGVEVNSGLSASDYEDVFVAGDVADTGFLKTAQNAEKEGIHVAENISSGDKLLDKFMPGTSPLLVSLGDNGMLIWDDVVVKNRLLRLLKDMVLRFYFLNLRRRKLHKRFFDSVKSSFSVFNIMGK